MTGRALSIDILGMGKRFGAFQALDGVSLSVPAGSFHALLGENGAGKSTLVKCLMGFYQPDGGEILLDGKQVTIATPREARALAIGMVYQHFTLVPSLTGAENLVMARADVPLVVDWAKETRALNDFLDRMPFRVPLDTPLSGLAAGQKQKLEILKQLYLNQRFLILDEPTSVLTPDEATEILGLLRGMTQAGDLTVLMITHKFREVTEFCDGVTVLRRGKKKSWRRFGIGAFDRRDGKADDR
ncbi:ATP-binding cassette domain-containing protein [Elstera litoralis]|uniref:ATP-binding cassette domain-containing protein n=1 Tax=Elstera litoralis TaxID=552518 RepID=UPI0018DB9A22|nr:ATP-binding cassette domain-containing protein [Elstera litoralis]